jgi:hypothetical protein
MQRHTKRKYVAFAGSSLATDNVPPCSSAILRESAAYAQSTSHTFDYRTALYEHLKDIVKRM